MKIRRVLLALMLLALSSAGAAAADLSKIERALAKEPTYRSPPKYCLLVFGPEARTKVWLVQDGDTLYVSRNSKGDLTEQGKKIVAEKDDGAEEGAYTFKAGDIRDGTRLHKALAVDVCKLDRLANQNESVKALLAKNPKARLYYIKIEMEMPGWSGTGIGGRVRQHAAYVDVHGVLQFADRPQDAPIIHFDDTSLEITLFVPHQLTIGRDTDMVLSVGTPGLGPGTTAFIDYGGVIPEEAYPAVEVTYPPKRPGEPPVQKRYELKRRC